MAQHWETARYRYKPTYTVSEKCISCSELNKKPGGRQIWVDAVMSALEEPADFDKANDRTPGTRR